jgi:hypothetical protein
MPRLLDQLDSHLLNRNGELLPEEFEYVFKLLITKWMDDPIENYNLKELTQDTLVTTGFKISYKNLILRGNIPSVFDSIWHKPKKTQFVNLDDTSLVEINSYYTIRKKNSIKKKTPRYKIWVCNVYHTRTNYPLRSFLWCEVGLQGRQERLIVRRLRMRKKNLTTYLKNKKLNYLNHQAKPEAPIPTPKDEPEDVNLNYDTPYFEVNFFEEKDLTDIGMIDFSISNTEKKIINSIDHIKCAYYQENNHCDFSLEEIKEVDDFFTDFSFLQDIEIIQ